MVSSLVRLFAKGGAPLYSKLIAYIIIIVTESSEVSQCIYPVMFALQRCVYTRVLYISFLKVCFKTSRPPSECTVSFY